MKQTATTESLAVGAVLCDLDGTLLDTVPDLYAAACAMLNDLARPSPLTELMSDNASAPPKEALDSFRRHYARENGRNSKPYPGVIAGLDKLKAMGLPLAVITNKAGAFTLPLLKMTGLAAYFDVVVSGDLLPKPKPDPMALIWACGRMGVSPADTLMML